MDANGNGKEISQLFEDEWRKEKIEYMSMQDYLNVCKNNSSAHASAAERMITAIGEPKKVDTSKDSRLSRIFLNQTILVYPTFEDFYGMEETIGRIVGFFKHAAQGLEESRQILYLLGPVGGGKSSLAERLKKLMEDQPIYVLCGPGDDEISPIFESPLGIFSPDRFAKLFEEKYHIPRRKLRGICSPWAARKLEQFKGKFDQFRIAKMQPSRLRQVCIAKTEPGDENNQDISTLVGKVDIRRLERFSQNDVEAYSFSGGLNRTTQGILEFVEMFKAPIKMLHPLITATQEGNYIGTENIGSIPHEGVILAHSNEAEWQAFKGKRENEAFIDRVNVVKVPYNLRRTEEVKIYEKMLAISDLHNAPCAPETLKMMAEFAVLSRLKDHENSNPYSKMRVYDGEDLKDTDTKAKAMQEYRDTAGVDEGMTGISPRFSFKVISRTFNHEPGEPPAADPVHLMYVLEQHVKREQYPLEQENRLVGFIKAELAPKFSEKLGEVIQKAYLESYQEYGQNMFDNYFAYAEAWIDEKDYKDPDTGAMFDREVLDQELSKTEKPAGIANPKDFRNEIVKFVLRGRANQNGQNPDWKSYAKIREVIEKRMFSQLEDLLPVISFGSKKDKKTGEKHQEFVGRMVKLGYTPRQVRRLVEWYIRVRKAG